MFAVELSEEELWGVFEAACRREDAPRAGRLWEILQSGEPRKIREMGEQASLMACSSSTSCGLILLKELLSRGAPAHPGALARCCEEGVADRAQKMDALWASGQARLERGQTPVIFLAAGIRDGGAAEAVERLVQMGADVQAANSNGVSAFDVAMMRQNLEVAEALLKGGAVPNERWRRGSSMFDDEEFERAYWVVVERLELEKAALEAGKVSRRPGL